jgi:SagB-type dehydrogenase family enzyme
VPDPTEPGIATSITGNEPYFRETMNIRLNAGVRIVPPSEACAHWAAENVLLRRRYKLSQEAAAVLVAACRQRQRDDLARQIAERDGKHRMAEFWAEIIDRLCRHELITSAAAADADPRVQWLLKLRRSWSQYGWHEAAEYHALAFDYPCLDYYEAAQAIAADRARMRGYQSVEPDSDRLKLAYADQPGAELPEPSADMATGTARSVWGEDRQTGAHLDTDGLAAVLSLAFGITGGYVPRTNSAPLIRRSSPSGGGRHPSEGYVVVRDIAGVESAWYHITMRPFSLRKLPGGQTDDSTLTRIFPDTIPRFPFDAKALVVVTSIFERNMYRYREPRTFRTVHMDAGHIAGSVRIAARALGFASGVFYCDAAERIEQVIGTDGMREGYMLTVAIGDGTKSRGGYRGDGKR